MNRMQWISLMLVVMIIGLATGQPTASACSFLRITAKDGALVTGRTMEFGADLKPAWSVTPRGKTFASPAPEGRTGLTWNVRHGYVAVDIFGDTNMVVDGMNEKGLVVSGLWYENDMQWSELPKDPNVPVLANGMVVSWLLGNFATTAEVAHAVKTNPVCAVAVPQMGMAPPLHLAVQDANGGSIVIEWDRGIVNIYENPLGIMTNAPNFPYMLTNLRNYAGLNAEQIAAKQYDGLQIVPTGHGAGMFGLPGDITPPSRFVRLAVLRQYADQASDAAGAVKLARHLLNTVYIPRGTVLDRNAAGDVTASESTQWTAYYDLTNRVVFFQTYDNSTLRKVDMKAIDFGAINHKAINLSDDAETIIDVTNRIH